MNFLDKAILYINPKKGYERISYREAAQRSYDSGSNSRRNSVNNVNNSYAYHTDNVKRDRIRE